MQSQYSCVSDVPATPLVANQPTQPTQLTNLFTAVLTNPNADTDQVELVNGFLANLATATGVSITHPALLPYSLPLMLRIAAGKSVPPPEPPTTTRVEPDQRDNPYSVLWTLCARLAESALILESDLDGGVFATELLSNPAFQEIQSAQAEALIFLVRFCRHCGERLNIAGPSKQIMFCRWCAQAHHETSDFPEIAQWAAEYDQVFQPEQFPYDLASMPRPHE